MISRLPFAIAATWMFIAGCGSPEPNETARPDLANTLRSLIPGLMAANGIPGLTLAIVRNGEIAYSQGFGVLHVSSRERVNADTVFEAASLSKPVFAYGVLRLAEQGKIDLDTPISRYLPGTYVHEQRPWLPPDRTRRDQVVDPRLSHLTPRMVLSHTSGLPNWAGESALQFLSDPGAKWNYSGEGYVYLQRAVERITGAPLDGWIQREVLDPLQMADSHFVWVARYSDVAASGHDSKGVPGPRFRATRPIAATSLYTTAPDYARFLRAVIRPDAGPLGEKSLVEMLSPQVKVDAALGMSWGLGWAIEDWANRRSFFHWGANPGYQSFAMGSRETGQALVMLTNSDNGLKLAKDVTIASIGGNHLIFSFRMMRPEN